MLKNPRLRLGVALWALAMTGVVALSLTVLSQLLAKAPQQIPVNVAIAVSMLQSAVLLALAVWLGVRLSRQVGLSAPLVEALLARSGAANILKHQALPATTVGVAVGLLLIYLAGAAPAQLESLATQIHIPLASKLLYGGITEEVLMRWGLMSLLVWLPWRFLQKRLGPPRSAYFIVGAGVAAVLFGVGHLPAVVAMGAELTAPIVAYIIVGNTIPGLLFGVLYWRWGLEAAVLAHALAHVISTLA